LCVHTPDDWTRPHLDRSALLLIDVQADFLDDGRSPVAGTSAVLPALTRLAGAFRTAGRPIFHVLRLYTGDDVDLVRRALVAGGSGPVRPGTPGSRIPDGLLGADCEQEPDKLLAGELAPVASREWLLWKPRWSAFHRTRLEPALHGLDVDTVVVAGCNFPNCPRATIFDASERDFRVVMVADATSGVTDERWSDLLAIGAVGMSTAELESALRQLN
jgi:nicotinamidase-related amidase